MKIINKDIKYWEYVALRASVFTIMDNVPDAECRALHITWIYKIQKIGAGKLISGFNKLVNINLYIFNDRSEDN